jgi:uncharacterized damage-inducible protein DinB
MDREHVMLLNRLNEGRAHVMGTLEGLTDAQLRQPMVPSGWHCLGMIKHLALSDEHYWFSCIVGGEPLRFFDAIEDEWQVGPDETAEDVFALYRREIERSNAIITATAVEAPPGQKDPQWEGWQMDFPDLRTIMLHVINETSCHAGHLDIVRELIDGHQWIAL